MAESPYSPLKAAWHQDRIASLRSGKTIVPVHVQLILSDLCNQDCHFCAYRMSTGISTEQFSENGNRNPNRMIPYDKAKEIIEDCSELGVKAIQFTGGGEPTVHPQHLELFGLAQSKGLETGLVTNGVLFRQGWEEVFPRMKWVRVSIDASSGPEYADVRRVKPEFYEKALQNVSNLASEIGKQGTACVLGVGYVVTNDNFRHLAAGVDKIRQSGADYVRLSAMFSTEGARYYSETLQEIRKAIDETHSLETPTFRVVDLFGNRISDLVQEAPDYEFCGYQQFNVYIGGNLKVYRCCTTAYTRHGEVGDLRNTRFADWAWSQDRQRDAFSFDARSCHVCQFNDKNRVINYLVSEPTHVNFV